jgi:hypothetical protein
MEDGNLFGKGWNSHDMNDIFDNASGDGTFLLFMRWVKQALYTGESAFLKFLNVASCRFACAARMHQVDEYEI